MDFEIKIEGNYNGCINWRLITAENNNAANAKYINDIALLLQSFTQDLQNLNNDSPT